MKGNVTMPTITKMERLGEINETTYGSIMKIISYINSNNIVVQFQDNNRYETNTTYKRFTTGNVKNPYDRSVCGTGYIGETSTRNNGIVKHSYYTWKAMMKRCYTTKYNSYKNVFVCEEWHCYANFEKWYDNNYWKCGEETMCLDKDILFINSKIYSPNTCLFIPNRINLLFQSIQYIIENGTRYNKKYKKYVVHVRHMESNKNDYFGSYKTKEESIEIYLKHKRLYIKQIANDYNNKYNNFPDKIYQAMINY